MQKTLAVSKITYKRLLIIQESWKKKHNATKSFDQVVVDLLDKGEKEVTA